MRKIEPLKGKIHLIQREDGTYGYYRDFDIKSAVELFLIQLNSVDYTQSKEDIIETLNQLIKDNFVDVMRR